MGKFCGRMKAKALNGGAPSTPLVPTATASGSSVASRLTPTQIGDEPLDLQKPTQKPVLSTNNTNNNNVLQQQPPQQNFLHPGIDSPPLTTAAAAIAAAAAAITGAGQAQSNRSSLDHFRQMTPTAKAQEILSAFNPIPQHQVPTPNKMMSMSHALQNHHHHQHHNQSSPSSMSPVGSVKPSNDAPFNLSVRRSHETDASSDSSADVFESVASALKAAAINYDDALSDLEHRIREAEKELERLKAKRLALMQGRSDVNKAARSMLNSVNGSNDTEHPVDAMIDLLQKRQNKRHHPEPTPLSNWPTDLQQQFRGPKRMRKSLLAARRNPIQNGSSALTESSELVNGVSQNDSNSPVSKQFSGGVGENNAESSQQPGTSDASSEPVNTPPSSEYHDEDETYANMVKGERIDDEDIDVEMEEDGHVLSIDEMAFQETQMIQMLPDENNGHVTALTVAGAFVFAATSNGCVARSRTDDESKATVLLRPFADEQEEISCIESWVFGDNDDDFAVLVASASGLFRAYNLDFTNVIYEKRLNWPITSLHVVAKRRQCFIGLKTGTLVTVDFDKMEISNKSNCGFGAIIGIDSIEGTDLVAISCDDGNVSIRDQFMNQISSFEGQDLAPFHGMKIVNLNGQNYFLASSVSKGLVGLPIGDNWKLDGKPMIISSGECTNFDRLSESSLLAIENAHRLKLFKVVSSDETRLAMAQDLFSDDDPTVSSFVAPANDGVSSCYFVSRSGALKIFRHFC